MEAKEDAELLQEKEGGKVDVQNRNKSLSYCWNVSKKLNTRLNEIESKVCCICYNSQILFRTDISFKSTIQNKISIILIV